MKNFILLILFLGVVFVQDVICQDDIVISAKVGVSVTFPCVESLPEGNTVLVVKWKLGEGKTILTFSSGNTFIANDYYQDRATINNETYALKLNDISLEDSGVYTCSVVTSDPTLEKTTNLTVYASPYVTVQEIPIVIASTEAVGMKKVAECNAVGGSLPLSIKWINPVTEETIIGDSERSSRANSDNANLTDVSLSLTVDVDPVRDYDRAYSCVVTDAAGRETKRSAVVSITVQTTAPPTTPKAKPRITSFPVKSMVAVKVGKSRRFECEVTGLPLPTVTWYCGSEKIAEGPGSATFTIKPTDLLDTTLIYMCQGVNSEGYDEKQFEIDIQAKPVMVSGGDELNETDTMRLSPGAKTFMLSCQAISNPPAKFLWKIIGENSTETREDLNQTASEQMVMSTVIFQADAFAEAKKTVECIASNKLGEASYQFVILPSEPQTAGSGWVIGIVIALVFIVVLVALILYFSLAAKRKKLEVNAEADAETGCLAAVCPSCCGSKADPVPVIVEGQDNEQIKEVQEEGTSEEKQKLTEAAEKPSEKESTSSENEPEEVPEKKKPKLRIGLPTQCCKSSKKKLKEEESVEEEEMGQKENGDRDVDSGKGDTLDKVIDDVEK